MLVCSFGNMKTRNRAITKLKSILSRKPFHLLSGRQQRRIALFNRLRKTRSTTCSTHKENAKNVQNQLIIESEKLLKQENSIIEQCSNENLNSGSQVHDQNRCRLVNITNNESNNACIDNQVSSVNITTENVVNHSLNIQHAIEIYTRNESNNLCVNGQFINTHISNERACNINNNEKHTQCIKAPFQVMKEELVSLFLETNTNLSAQKKYLNFLRKYCFPALPSDPRTLVNTPRIFEGILIDVPPGQYMHIGFAKVLVKILNRTPTNLIPTNTLLIDFNIDGCELNKKYEMYPIQLRISNIPESDVEVVGIYKGRTKPTDVNLFLKCFITDVNEVRKKKLVYGDAALEVDIRLFSLDLVARAYILRHKNHNSKKPCTKCKVKGYRYKNTSVYSGVNHDIRTDDEYSRMIDAEHHTGKSPLLELGIGLVTQVPIDPMHCLYLGINKKILIAWTKGTYGKQVKLSPAEILKISDRIRVIVKYCPREFARLPETLNYLKDFKATQHRQFLLYFGLVVINGIVSENVYIHYLLLSTAIRCLSFKNPSTTHLSFARLALKSFIEDAEFIYNLNFLSSNVHNLCHLVDDVEMYGSIESYAAWPYENNMSFFRKYYNKPGAPLQQIYNRLVEQDKRKIDKIKIFKSDNHSRLFNPWIVGPLPLNVADDVLESWSMFKNLELKNFTLGVNLRDNTCILEDSSICIVKNIYKVNNNLIYLLIKRFRFVEDAFDVGIPSSSVGTYKCSLLSTDSELIEHTYVKNKCYRMPVWQDVDDKDSTCSSENDEPLSGFYIVSVLM